MPRLPRISLENVLYYVTSRGAGEQELASLEESMAKLKKLAEATLDQTKQEVLAKMEDAKVTEKEITEIAKLKVDLDKKGLDIPTLVKLAKEV